MQIVIDIPEKDYKKVIDFGRLDMCGIELAEAVLNGTPLPKGHGRLIDVKDIYDYYKSTICDIEDAIEQAPTIIEADKQ